MEIFFLLKKNNKKKETEIVMHTIANLWRQNGKISINSYRQFLFKSQKIIKIQIMYRTKSSTAAFKHFQHSNNCIKSK